MKKTLIGICICALIITGCYRDVEEQLYPGEGGACDTAGVTYSGAVVSLLTSNGCLSCHSGGAPSGGVLLNSYTSVRAVALNGKLYGAINHSAGFSPMPKGGNKMNSCSINKIKAWIDAGAPNN